MPITSLADAAVARAVVVRFADELGMSKRAASEAAIAASELVTNMVKYAGAGELVLGEEQGCLLITALDRGPGPPSEAELFVDGVSRGGPKAPTQSIAGGRGTGGGALRRFCDRVELEPRPGGGAIVRCHKRVR